MPTRTFHVTPRSGTSLQKLLSQMPFYGVESARADGTLGVVVVDIDDAKATELRGKVHSIESVVEPNRVPAMMAPAGEFGNENWRDGWSN